MALKGNLEDLNIIEIFQTIARQDKSGDLIIYNKKDISKVTFHRGEIIDVGFSDPKKGIEQFFLNKKLVRDWEMKTLIKKSKKQIKKLSYILLENNIIDIKLRKKLIELYYKQGLFDIFDLKKGKFELKTRTISDNDLSFYELDPIDVDQIILESVRQKDEMGLIKKEIPISHAIVTKVLNSGAEVNNLTDEERELYLSFSSSISIDELYRSVIMFKFEVLQTIVSLKNKNLLVIKQNLIANKDKKEINFIYPIRLITILSITITLSFLLYQKRSFLNYKDSFPKKFYKNETHKYIKNKHLTRLFFYVNKRYPKDISELKFK